MMRIGLFAILGLVMTIGCATAAPAPNVTVSVERIRPVASKSYVCRARYAGIEVMYLACTVNPAVPNDTGDCNIEYYAESTLEVSDAGLFDLRCRDPDLPGVDASAFTRRLKLELLEAYSYLSRMARR